ncbi:MAG TPA: hypothetical protein VFQ45_18970, partial [Longimicrobium sp.]|nr:hypothetical protein [Longimicrobium sp.]
MSYSLEGLLRRLKRMPPRGFAVLDDAVIRAPAVTRLFGALLGFPGDALPVQSWLLRPAGDVSVVTEVELVGEVPFFGVENARAAFAFTLDEAGELRLVLRCILGPMTVADMLAGGLLPGSAWAAGPAAAALAGFPRVAFTLDSAGSTLRVQGAPSLAGWDVGLPGTALGPVSPDIVRSAPPPPAPPLWDPGFTTSLSVGSLGLPVRVAVPAGLSGWKVALADPAGVAVGDLSALDPLLGGAGAALPGPLAGMGQLRVTSLDLGFAAQAPRTWTVAAELSVGAPGAGDGPVWRLVPGVVELDRLQARLAWTLVSLPGGVFSASAAGTVTGQVTVLGQPAAATLPVPAGPDGWLLEVPASITLPGLADLAPYFGGQDYLGAALAPLGTLQGLVLAWVSARFDPEAFSFTEVSFALEAASWSVPALPWFRAGGIALDAVVTRPLDPAARVVRVAAAAVLSLGPLPELLLTGGYDGATGLLDMEWTGMPFEPMPLADLAALVTADELAAAVPAGLPTGGAFNLGRLAFRYDTGWQSLQRVELSLGSAAPWTLVPDVLVLESFDLALALAWSAAGAPATVTGAVTAPLRLGDAEVLLEAARPAAGEPWTFSASLSTDAEVDFAALLAQLGAGAVLPGGWGFPASLTLQALDVVLVPSVPSLTVNGAAFLDWSVPFAGGAFTLGGVEGMLELAPGRTSAWIAGTFRLAGLSGAATLALGGPGGAVRVAVEVADAGAVSPAAQVDALCGAGAWAAVPAPAGFATPSFFSAGMLLDLTAGSYLVHGEFGRGAGGLYGAVVLLVQQDASGAWGFALAAGLESWTFADLSPALAGVDAVLGVERAGAAVALTSLQGSAAAQAIAPWIPALAGELTDGPGLYFRATLDFATGLTAQLVPLLDVSAAGPFTVQGYLPGGAGAATFTATLGSLTLLGALSFRDVVLVYRVDGGRTLTLTGTIALSVPLLQGTAPLVFAGAMTVDDEEAVFQAATTQSVASPLGIPGVTLEELALTLDRDFAGGGATTLSLEGSVQLGGVGLAGRVVFQDGAAVVSVVSLTRPLPV